MKLPTTWIRLSDLKLGLCEKFSYTYVNQNVGTDSAIS